MHLAATALTEFWDPTDENLLLGPWCARYERRAELKAVRHRFLPDPWTDAARFERAVDYCAETSERLMLPLGESLNAALGVDYGPKYWRIIVYPWLLYHMQQMYSHYTTLQDAFALEPSLKALTLDPASYRTPRDTGDYLRLAMEDPYNLQISSQLLAERRFPTRRFEDWPDTPPPLGPHRPFKRRLKDAASWLVARLAALGAGQLLICDLHISRSEYLRLSTGTHLRFLPFFGTIPPGLAPAPVMDERRCGLAKLAATDEFERLFIAALPHNFPTLYLEGYAAARRHVLPWLWKPRALFSSVGWHYHEAFKFAAAECAERGSLLWGMQHGGGYGQIRQNEAERLERAVTDRFYTWGWSSLESDPKLRDLPPPQFDRVRRKGPGEGLLIVSITIDRYNYRLFRATNGEFALDYIARTGRIWNALPPKLRVQSELRLYKDYGWRQEERIREACPDLKVDNRSRQFVDRLSNCRLLIVDFPSTTLWEAFAADAPCILTWNPTLFSYTDSAKPHFDALKKVGILFDDPEEAAKQAARAYDDPRGWWDAPERRKAHRDFTKYFARGSADWLNVWLRELEAGLADDAP